MIPVPPDKWKWYGSAAHFICGRYCRFHMATRVGRWLVSTVGEYVHPRHVAGSEAVEAAWLKANRYGEEIGWGRKFETMVFRVRGSCDCGCGLPTMDGQELDGAGYNHPADATKGHYAMCRKWAQKRSAK